MTLQRAHVLDGEAVQLSNKGDFVKAALLHAEAQTLFDQAADSTLDPSAAKTLRLLAQRQRLAADEARRRSTQQAPDRASKVNNKPYIKVAPATTAKRANATQESVYASSMMGSRMTSTSAAPGQQSPAASIFPEGSYMVLRDDMNSSDPFQRFNRAIDGLLTQVSAPVAFAALPLAVPKANKAKSTSATTLKHKPNEQEEASGDQIGESFFIVSPTAPPSSHQPDRPAFLPKSKLPPVLTTTASTSTKTIEELSMENASLKQDLDLLTSRFHKLVSESKKEKESLKASILTLGKDIKKESDRIYRIPSGAINSSEQTEKREGADEVETLKQELALAKLNAAKYKARYDQLRDAIKKKRSAKEAEQISPSAGSNTITNTQGESQSTMN